VTRLYQELEDAKSRVQFLEGEIQRFSGSFGRLVGTNHVLQKRVDTARQVAPSGASVLLTGESGTGKEAFARGIHESSGRKGMFVPVNCSAVPAELFEAEFFGYAGGAFTGANRRGKLGFFELANDGTLFLDEIGEMPPAIQAKLLRVLQEREFIRVGGEEIVRVDVRIVSATNRSLEDMLEKGMFRKDLYYRLNVVEINLPPLRERLDDLPVLVEHFVAAFSQGNAKTPKIMSQEAMAMLRRYLWPGNIRELMNVLENLVVTCPGEVIESRHVPENISRHLALEVTGPSLDSDSPSLDLKLAIQERESQIIQAALRLADHNKSRAALLLNIPRASLYNKMSAYGLHP
jgi:transcriptional regulator with PAS, ATPase and Fis domain